MNNKKQKQFGARLKELRIRATLTQRGLATKVGVTPSYLSKIEHGVLAAPSASTISKIASILKTDANELLSLAGKFPNVISLRLREHTTLEFGKKLKGLRNKSGLSQLKLARQVFVDPSYICKLETMKIPPPSRKILLRMAKVLRVSENELTAITGKTPPATAEKQEMGQMFRDVYQSIKRNMNVPNLSRLTNKGWGRVAISVLLVVSITSGLWLASPRPVEAVTVSFPSTPGGSQSSSHTFTVRVDITGATDLLPVQSVDIWVNDQTGANGFTLTGVPLTATTTTFSPSGVGTVSVTATPGSNWAYATSGGTTHTGYGYGYTTGAWGYPSYGVSGYGYGYTGGVAGDTYIVFSVTWTPPSAWPTGTYNTNAVVHGNGSPTTSLTSPTPGSFTVSAAAATPTPTPGGDDGVPSVSSSEDVSDIVNEDGEFTRSVTVSSADGRATFTIPSGTIGLTAEGDPLSEITITNVKPPRDMPPAGTSFSMGIHFDCEPTGATFEPPALLTFEYNPNWLPPGATPDNLTIAYYDEDTGLWVELGAEDIEIDRATNTITARVSHFTVFSTLVRINPASFEVSGLKISPTSADIAEKVTISATVTNTGDLAGSYGYEVVLKINGQPVSFKKVSVAGGASEQVTFTTVQGQAGSYSVSIDGLSGTFTITALPTSPIVIAPSVPQVVAPEVVYPAPTAPAPPAVPAPVPTPTPWLAIILSLVVTGIVAGILVWYYGFRREY